MNAGLERALREALDGGDEEALRRATAALVRAGYGSSVPTVRDVAELAQAVADARGSSVRSVLQEATMRATSGSVSAPIWSPPGPRSISPGAAGIDWINRVGGRTISRLRQGGHVCPACGSADVRFEFGEAERRRRAGSGGPVEWRFFCGGCGHSGQTRPDEFDAQDSFLGHS